MSDRKTDLDRTATEQALYFGRMLGSITDQLTASLAPGQARVGTLRRPTPEQALEQQKQRNNAMPLEVWRAIVNGIKHPSVGTLEWLCRIDQPEAPHWQACFDNSANMAVGEQRRADRAEMRERIRRVRGE